uniref:Uncharacterized protein n=1 Tax=Arundo donax TaxID=35708 RepID=A0A0A9HUT6_ARUDO
MMRILQLFLFHGHRQDHITLRVQACGIFTV